MERFCSKEGTPEHVITWYEDLFEKVTNDPAWRETYEKDGIDVVNGKGTDSTSLLMMTLQLQKLLIILHSGLNRNIMFYTGGRLVACPL